MFSPSTFVCELTSSFVHKLSKPWSVTLILKAMVTKSAQNLSLRLSATKLRRCVQDNRDCAPGNPQKNLPWVRQNRTIHTLLKVQLHRGCRISSVFLHRRFPFRSGSIHVKYTKWFLSFSKQFPSSHMYLCRDLYITNSCINFFLYMAAGTRFRQDVKKLFKRKGSEKIPTSASVRSTTQPTFLRPLSDNNGIHQTIQHSTPDLNKLPRKVQTSPT